MSAKDSLLVALGLFGILHVIALTSGVGRVRRGAALAGEPARPSGGSIATGFVPNFFDTLGIAGEQPRVAFQSGKVRFFDATGRVWSVYDCRRLKGRIRKTAIAAEVAT